MTLEQVVTHARTVKTLAELGDVRLLASDGPAGGQRPEFSNAEGLKFDRAAYLLACWILETCDMREVTREIPEPQLGRDFEADATGRPI